MIFVRILFLIVCSASMLIYGISALSAAIISKKAGIIKVIIDLRIYILLALNIVLIVIGVIMFSFEKDCRDDAKYYERMLEIYNSGIDGSNGAQHLSSSSLRSRTEIEQAVKKLNTDADRMEIIAFYSLWFGISRIPATFSGIVYITEEGIVTSNMKVPEPITAVFRDGDIEVDLKADLANKNRKSAMIFKGTPQNLAKFGRFIEWDEPETDAAEQAAPPPDNNNMMT